MAKGGKAVKEQCANLDVLHASEQDFTSFCGHIASEELVDGWSKDIMCSTVGARSIAFSLRNRRPVSVDPVFGSAQASSAILR